MKRLLVLWALVIVLVIPVMSQSITLVKSYSSELTVESKLDCDVNVVVWDESYIRCVTTVEIDSFANGEWILGQLSKVGRYSIIMQDGYMVMPNIEKEIYVKGRKLSERISVKLLVPVGTSVLFREIM